MFDHWEFMGWGGVMGLFWLVILLLLVWLAVGLFRRDGGGGQSAREILDKRYARGEIDETEYRRRRAELDDQ